MPGATRARSDPGPGVSAEETATPATRLSGEDAEQQPNTDPGDSGEGDASLVHAAREGNARAFEELLRRDKPDAKHTIEDPALDFMKRSGVAGRLLHIRLQLTSQFHGTIDVA